MDGSTKPALLLTPRQAAEALAISPRKLWGMSFEERSGPTYGRLRRGIRYVVTGLARCGKDRCDRGQK